MTKREFEKYRDENLIKRFYWCFSVKEKKYLMEKGHPYLFACTHYKRKKIFWVFDQTERLKKDVKIWKKEREKKASESSVDK